MVIFYSYVKLPEGTSCIIGGSPFEDVNPHGPLQRRQVNDASTGGKGGLGDLSDRIPCIHHHVLDAESSTLWLCQNSY